MHGGFCRRFRLENRYRRFAHFGADDTQSVAGAVQFKQPDRNRKDRSNGDAEFGKHQSSPAICFLRILRTVHQIANAATGTNAAVTILGSTGILPLSWAAFTR